MLDLSLHGDAEQSDEVHDKDRPENRDIKHLEECAEEGHQSRLGDAVPELEFWESPHEGTELLIGLGRQPRPIIIIMWKRRVNLGSEEGKEEVEVIDAESVADNVPALPQHDAHHEAEDESQREGPARGRVGRPFV